MEAFPPKDHASGLRNLDFNKGPVPMQRSLGVHWYLKSDSFTFQGLLEEKTFTRGEFCRLTKTACMIPWAQSSLKENTYSDHLAYPLPAEREAEWKKWCHSLRALEDIKVPRSYGTEALKRSSPMELHTFCHNSEMAISAVSYLRIIYNTCQVKEAFVLGKAKLTPAPQQYLA